MGKCLNLRQSLGGFRINRYKRYKCHPKINLLRTIGKLFKIGGGEGEREGVGNGLTDVENPRYSQKAQTLRLQNFFSKGNFDTGSEISFIGTMDISSYT